VRSAGCRRYAGWGWDVAWVALGTWLLTAAFGLNLAIRGGAIRLLTRAPWERGRRRRAGSGHRLLFLGHVLFALAGLALWGWYAFADTGPAGWAAAVLLVVVAGHGLSLVERWTPGRGRHATGRTVDHTRRGYFPVLPATGHVMVATVTVVLVVLAMLHG
jgi:hypothetical protein